MIAQPTAKGQSCGETREVVCWPHERRGTPLPNGRSPTSARPLVAAPTPSADNLRRLDPVNRYARVGGGGVGDKGRPSLGTSAKKMHPSGLRASAGENSSKREGARPGAFSGSPPCCL